jgi:hypothetical protein
MIQCETDPCVFYRVNIQEYLDLVIVCHVDGSIIAGSKPVIDKYLKDFEKHLKIERLGKMKKHLGIWWAWKEDERGVYLEGSMDKMKEEIINQYEKLMGKDARLAVTSGYPGKILEKSEPDAPVMMQMEYISIIGKLQYYQTKIGPTICNSVRELSTHLQHPGEEHWKSVGRLGGYLKSKETVTLTMRSPEELRCISLCDSNYAQCEETRRSISGGLDTLGRCLFDWLSKKQPIVGISTTGRSRVDLLHGKSSGY